ncbi:hypothetical protein [Amycolatopsis sp. 195334CR]|uniref:hypothetical protein n=1 Tax=Amycolatopsis sp. 195334CR TaxID=2814588 RepID=UPI001A8EFB26|nr:hypothetical protein [Amycolatopsis sp. 195334CR]MBN6040387.1 hypothetical protein [Amycolatopsis sp. 195334CR]
MRKQLACLFAAAISMGGLLAGAPAAGAAEDRPPSGCDAYRYGFLWGEGVSMTCFSLPGPAGTYRVVAHCTNGSAYWFTVGEWVPLWFGPSTAECRGGLLWNAYLAGYHVEDF